MNLTNYGAHALFLAFQYYVSQEFGLMDGLGLKFFLHPS